MQYVKSLCGTDTSLADRLNIPFFLLVSGYTLILIIDKVLFDTHAILGHDGHDEEGEGEDAVGLGGGKGSILRQSIAKILKDSVNGEVEEGSMSQRQIETAVRKSLAGSLKKSDVFAQKVSDARANRESYKAVSDDDLKGNKVSANSTLYQKDGIEQEEDSLKFDQ